MCFDDVREKADVYQRAGQAGAPLRGHHNQDHLRDQESAQ